MSASRLERQIDAWLRWYPRSWRAANGAAIRGALLDQAEATGADRLHLADRVALASAGMSARQAGRSRLVSILAGIGFVAFAVVYAALISWSPGYAGPGATFGFTNPSVLALTVGVGAVVCAFLAFPRAAIALAVSAVVLQSAFVISSAVSGGQGPSVEMLIVFSGLLAVAALPFQRRRTLVIALASVVALAIAVELTRLVLVPTLVDVVG